MNLDFTGSTLFLVLLLFAVGLICIIKGGDLFVDAATWIAEASGIPKFIIGATVVSFATTMPEMLVSIFSALEGNADIAIGNAVGSVTANTGLIMCLSLICMECTMPRRQYAVKAVLLQKSRGYCFRDSMTCEEIGQAIKNQQIIEIEYERMKEPRLVRRRVQPVGIMFSEYYFYLTAFLEDKTDFENPDDLFPTIYRIDRIHSFKALDEHFRIPYTSRFEEGEFRKRIQFMYGGKLERVKFRYSGPSIEAVLDRLPTARILSQDENGWTIEAEAFGKGIEMWLRSQGEYIEAVI